MCSRKPGCIHAFEEEINGRSLRSLLCPSAETLEEFLSEMPASLSSAHFDVAAALGPEKMAGFAIVLQVPAGPQLTLAQTSSILP